MSVFLLCTFEGKKGCKWATGQAVLACLPEPFPFPHVSGLGEFLVISDRADNVSLLNCCFDFSELKSKSSASMAESFDWNLTLQREGEKEHRGK